MRPRPANLLKKRRWHRCFPVNFAKFPRTPFLQNISSRLLLWLQLFNLYQLNQKRNHYEKPVDWFAVSPFNHFMHNVVKWPNILLKSCVVNTVRFLKYVWPFCNIMHARVNNEIGLKRRTFFYACSVFWLEFSFQWLFLHAQINTLKIDIQKSETVGKLRAHLSNTSMLGNWLYKINHL